MSLKRLIAHAVLVTIIGLIGLVVLMLFEHILIGALSSLPGLGWIEGWPFLMISVWVWLFLPGRYKVLRMDYASGVRC